MFYSERDAIDIYERKYSIQEIWWMDEDDRLLFAPVRRNRNRIRNIVRNAVEAIELGIPMPPIYVSEQQNGDYLVLESKDTIYSLLQFLKNNMGIEIDQDDADRRMSFYEIDHENPRLASMIMRTVVPVQIIEYRSPKYMHMLTGKFIENWTENREYAIRKIIYKDSRIELIERIREVLCKFQRTGLVRSLNEINIFYMLVIWMAYTNKENVDEDRYITNEQYLLENAIYEMDNLRDGYIDDFVECVLHTCSRCEEIDYEKTVRIVNRRFDEKYKSIFMAIAICMNDIRGNLRELYDERSYLYSMLHDTSVTYANISRWINYLRR